MTRYSLSSKRGCCSTLSTLSSHSPSVMTMLTRIADFIKACIFTTQNKTAKGRQIQAKSNSQRWIAKTQKQQVVLPLHKHANV